MKCRCRIEKRSQAFTSIGSQRINRSINQPLKSTPNGGCHTRRQRHSLATVAFTLIGAWPNTSRLTAA